MKYIVKTKTITLKLNDHIILENVKSPEESAKFLRAIFENLDGGQEHVVVLFLMNNNIVGFKCLFSGAQSECAIDPKILMRNVLYMGADGIILAHNHPSGIIEPSSGDLVVTNKIKECCNLLDIRFFDHIIISYDKYCSLAKLGYL